VGVSPLQGNLRGWLRILLQLWALPEKGVCVCVYVCVFQVIRTDVTLLSFVVFTVSLFTW
jgi:hypothetical protein